MTKIFWFSRHDMDESQVAALERKFGAIEVTKVNGTAPNVHVGFPGEVNNDGEIRDLPPLKEQVAGFDVVAVVAPITLQQQLKGVLPEGVPLIIVKNDRVFSGGEKVQFKFVHWEEVEEIKVVTSVFAE
jgi:hypothetical protein